MVKVLFISIKIIISSYLRGFQFREKIQGGELVFKMNEVIKTLASMRITFLARKNGPKKVPARERY